MILKDWPFLQNSENGKLWKCGERMSLDIKQLFVKNC